MIISILSISFVIYSYFEEILFVGLLVCWSVFSCFFLSILRVLLFVILLKFRGVRGM